MLVLALGGCMWWGIHPPRTEHAYWRESASTLQLLRSDVETAKLWLTSYAEDKVTSQATKVALTETETDANRRSSSYSPYRPPAFVESGGGCIAATRSNASPVRWLTGSSNPAAATMYVSDRCASNMRRQDIWRR